MRTTTKEAPLELLDRYARSPRRCGEGRFGSVIESVRRPIGSLINRSSRRCSVGGLIPVCLPVTRREYVSAPKRYKTYRPMDDLEAVAGSPRRCAVHHAVSARNEQV